MDGGNKFSDTYVIGGCLSQEAQNYKYVLFLLVCIYISTIFCTHLYQVNTYGLIFSGHTNTNTLWLDIRNHPRVEITFQMNHQRYIPGSIGCYFTFIIPIYSFGSSVFFNRIQQLQIGNLPTSVGNNWWRDRTIWYRKLKSGLIPIIYHDIVWYLFNVLVSSLKLSSGENFVICIWWSYDHINVFGDVLRNFVDIGM